jgi:hypothetical protein
MSDSLEVKIVATPSLLDHLREGLGQQGTEELLEDKLIELLRVILDGSEFPIAAERTGERGIRISYHLRSFSQPIF